MTEDTHDFARPDDVVGRALFSCSYAFVLLGGFIMAGLAVMVVVSVLGRWLVSIPVYGDFEMVAMGTAVSVFLFLPYCHLEKGNVICDLFLSWAPKKLQILCDVVSALILGVIAAVIAWRMTLGGLDMFSYGETSMILGIPTWWAFPFAVASMGLLALCCLYTAVRDFLEVVR